MEHLRIEQGYRATVSTWMCCLAASLSGLLATAPSALAETGDTCAAPYIQAHLERVERELVSADVSHLDPTQRTRRAHMLEVLADYRRHCEFPRNTLAPDRLVTVFVDDRDVHCAVGYLMAQDGRSDLVTRIRATRNTATIQELGADAEVAAWLESAGLSAAEAARIQPTYCFSNRGGTCLCRGYEGREVLGVAEATIRALVPERDEVEADVTRVHGQGATVGETVSVSAVEGDVVDRHILVVLRREDTTTIPARGAQAIAGDDVSCTSGQSPDPMYCALVPQEIYVAALLSEDCMASLAAHDPDLNRSVCDLDGARCQADGTPILREASGCAGGGTSWLGVGLALIVWANRRSPSRRRRCHSIPSGTSTPPRARMARAASS